MRVEKGVRVSFDAFIVRAKRVAVNISLDSRLFFLFSLPGILPQEARTHVLTYFLRRFLRCTHADHKVCVPAQAHGPRDS